MNGRRILVVAAIGLCAALWTYACGDGATEPPPPAPDPPRPATVAVAPASVQFTALGATEQLTAEVRDQNGNAMAGATVTWTSSAAAVATVSATGLVTAVASGTATITATAGSASGGATVTVAQEVSAVAVTPSADTVVAGDTLRLAAEAADANGHSVAGAEVDWASSDTLVVVVDEAGLVTGVGAGEAEVMATAAGVTGRAALTVVAPMPTAVEVTPDTVALTALGQTAQLAAEVRDQIGRVMEGVRVSWSSTDTTIAAVDSAGLVTAIGGGATTVAATAGAVSGAGLVTVMQSAGSVVVSPSADTVALGDTLRLTAEAFDENAHRVKGAEFAWSSSDGSIAAVDATGLVLGVREGRVTITATTGDVQGTAEVTVENPDRAALVALYNTTDGPNWVNNENWLSDAPLGDWYGVDTDGSGRIVGLNLAGKTDNWPDVTPHGLEGPIPPEIGSLASLRRLNLSYNDLTGPIHVELGNLASLTSLGLGGNQLTGPIPSELGNLTNLTWLYLRNNDLTGPIPPALSSLGNLGNLDLSENDLTGPIPPALDGLTDLSSLHLARNNLTGPIPAELGDLANLERLSLSWNALTGPLPENLLKLTKLRRFDFQQDKGICAPGIAAFADWLEAIEEAAGPFCNEFDRGVLESLFEAAHGPGWTNAEGWLSGPVLADWYGIHSDSLGRVTALDLSRNGLAGRLPGILGELAQMTELRITGNADLSGRLPLSLARLALQVLHYSGTELCAPVEPTFRDWLSAIPSHESTGAECAQHYPIHVRWHWCDWTPEAAGCLPRREIDPDTVAGLPVHMVPGIRDGIAAWAQVLAPTPAPASYVVPPDGTPRRWDFWCRAWRGDWLPGDTIRAGLELHVVIEVDADPGDDHAPPPGGGPPCFYDTWQYGDTLVPVLTGIIHVSPEFFGWRRGQSYAGWRWFAMHEIGHVVGVGDWGESIEPTPDGSGVVVTRDAIVAAFDRLGGAEYPGKKVPLSEGGSVHWHRCVARNDVMASGGDFNTQVITDLSLSALRLGFQAEPQGYALPTDAWHTCPELR